MPASTLKVMIVIILTVGLPVAKAADVSIAVAANFTGAARALASLFEETTGHHTKISYGSTGKLYTQIINGAPFEIFLAADSKRPQKAEDEELVVQGSRFTYARGRLVLWSPRPDLFDDGAAYLEQAAFTRLAIANPKTAPYGLAAKQVLEKQGLWGRVQGKLVRGDSIAQTFQFVATENAEAGFVAYAQIRKWPGESGSAWVVPEHYHSPIEQQAVWLKKGENNSAAAEFMIFLKSAEARAIIEDFGYGL